MLSGICFFWFIIYDLFEGYSNLFLKPKVLLDCSLPSCASCPPNPGWSSEELHSRSGSCTNVQITMRAWHADMQSPHAFRQAILSWWSWWRISFKIPPQILRPLRVKDWLKPSKLVGDVSFDKTQVNLQKQTQGFGPAAVYQHKAVYRFISALSFVLFHHTLHFILSGLQVNGFLGASGVGGALGFLCLPAASLLFQSLIFVLALRACW